MARVNVNITLRCDHFDQDAACIDIVILQVIKMQVGSREV